MILSKKGAAAALKEAYKSGYEVIPEKETITLCAGKWSAVERVRETPKEISQQLVDHVGYIPTYPEKVRKNDVNQTVILNVVEYRKETMEAVIQGAVTMWPIPIIFKSKWQLFTTANQEIHAFDTALLEIIDENAVVDTYVTKQGLGRWKRSVDEAVFIAPGHFDAADQEKLLKIAEMYKMPRIMEEDEPENLSMFDDLEGEAEE